MKKLLSVLLCFVLITFVLGGISAISAETNLCSVLDEVEWFEACHNHGDYDCAEFSAFTIYKFTSLKVRQMPAYSAESGALDIPADEFEACAEKWFKVSSFEAIRALTKAEVDDFDSGYEGAVYNSADKTYFVPFIGGRSFETEYHFMGYVKNGSNYDVYLRGSETYMEAPAGKDYVEMDYMGDTVYVVYTDSYIRYTVGYNGSNIKYISNKKVSGMPASLIKPGDVVSSSSVPAVSSKPAEPSSSELPASSHTAVPSETEESVSMPTVAEVQGITLKAEENVFPEDTVVEVKEIKNEGDDRAVYDVVETALEKNVARFVPYEITAMSGNAAVQPNGKVLAYFDIPRKFDPARTAVYYVSPEGAYEKIPSTVGTVEGKIVAELSHFSTYVVAEEISVGTTIDNDGNNDGGSTETVIVIIVIAAVLLAATAVILYIFVIKKKN